MSGDGYTDYFHLQLRFAQRYAALSGLPLTQAVDGCTNLRRRFGMAGFAGEERWAAFLMDVRHCSHLDEVLQIAVARYKSAPRAESAPFGCFTYDAPDLQGMLRLHFMPEERHRHSSPLSATNLAERRSELRRLFMEVRTLHRDVRQVRGFSWLYHLPAYRSLFPPAYLNNLSATDGPLHLTGSSIWGQVLDHRHRLRPGIAQRVLAGLEASAVTAPWKAFPLQPLGALCAADHFFGWFLSQKECEV